MKLPLTTIPDLSVDSIKHQKAAALGDENYLEWSRNVIDEYKPLSTEQIKIRLRETSFPYAVCFENWIADINLATGIRNCNAFNCREIFYIGRKKFHRRGLMGVHNYTELTWLPIVEDLLALKEKYSFVGVDNITGAQPINDYVYPTVKPPMFIFGSEGAGLTPAIQSMCDQLVYIKQYGSVRSINCGTASGILLNDFVTKYVAINN